MNIFVARLSSNTGSDELKSAFEQFGEVQSAKVIYDRETGNSKCFGFVEMEDDNEAYEAITNLNEADLDGRTIVVKKARPKNAETSASGY